MVSNADVVRYLEALDFPASKDEIIAEAIREGAPDDVLRALRALPPVDYANRSEVGRSADVTLTEETAAEKATKARDRAHGGVAEHLRTQPPPPPPKRTHGG